MNKIQQKKFTIGNGTNSLKKSMNVDPRFVLAWNGGEFGLFISTIRNENSPTPSQVVDVDPIRVIVTCLMSNRCVVTFVGFVSALPLIPLHVSPPGPPADQVPVADLFFDQPSSSVQVLEKLDQILTVLVDSKEILNKIAANILHNAPQ